MYKVIQHFTDLTDNGYAYFPGDEYPREGTNPSAERIAELASENNRRGEPVITEYVDFPRTEVKAEAPKEEPKKRGRRKNA